MLSSSRRTVLRWLLILIIMSGWCTGCSSPTPTLRVLTYNIHHGEGTDGVFDLERIAEVIRRAQPDLVALQEVDRHTGRASGIDQASELARLTGLESRYGAAMEYDGGEYGEAILSRLRIDETTNHALPHSPGYEPRCALAVTVHIKGIGEVLFAGTHLQHNLGSDRVEQARELNHLFANEEHGAALLAGDLNARPTDEPMRILLEHWSPADPSWAPTFPSRDPDRKIDYVLVRPMGNWEIISATVLDEPLASDHAPLLVVLQWRPGDDGTD